MRNWALFAFAVVVSVTTLVLDLHPKANAGAVIAMLGVNDGLADRAAGLVTKIKKKHQGGADANQGERTCPAGYVVLDKPNKYGSFCEPKEGLPAPEAAKCKLGMIGTPPNAIVPMGRNFSAIRVASAN